jgi:hypothetical protein
MFWNATKYIAMPMVIAFFAMVIVVSAYGVMYHPVNSLIFTTLSVINIVIGLLLIREFADALINYDYLEFSEDMYEDSTE